MTMTLVTRRSRLTSIGTQNGICGCQFPTALRRGGRAGAETIEMQKCMRRNIIYFIQNAKMTSVTVQAKAALRQEIANGISKLTCEEKKRQSKIVYDKLIKLQAFAESKRVSVFLSTADEIDTEPLVRKIFELEKKCYVPRYSKAGMHMVRLHSMDDWEKLPVTKWNIKQPSLKEPREDAIETGGLDLIICPGVAFTKNGDRMGHGGGYYDAYITKLKEIQQKAPSTVAVAFREQVLDSIPLTPKDVRIDAVLFAE